MMNRLTRLSYRLQHVLEVIFKKYVVNKIYKLLIETYDKHAYWNILENILTLLISE